MPSKGKPLDYYTPQPPAGPPPGERLITVGLNLAAIVLALFVLPAIVVFCA